MLYLYMYTFYVADLLSANGSSEISQFFVVAQNVIAPCIIVHDKKYPPPPNVKCFDGLQQHESNIYSIPTLC